MSSCAKCQVEYKSSYSCYVQLLFSRFESNTLHGDGDGDDEADDDGDDDGDDGDDDTKEN